jgi:uncharacterized protein
LLYLPDTLRFFKANKATIRLFELIDAGNSFDEILQVMPKTNRSDFDSMHNIIRQEDNKLANFADAIVPNESWKGYLPRLVLNISNDCNLRCGYCYAHGGNYESSRMVMPESLALLIMDTFYTIFDKIDLIQLFGGEPLMNVPVIEIVAKYIAENSLDTRIGIVTNGTLIDKEVISLITKYNMNVTLSIDHEDLQDALRPHPKEDNIYGKIKENILELQRASGQPSQIEVVYTQEHIRRGVSVAEVLRALQNDFGKLPIHLTPVCSDNKKFKLKNETPFTDAIDDMFADSELNPESDYSLTGRIISTLRLRYPQTNICSAGFGTISVSTSGDVFPCFYFTDNADFKSVNVNESLSKVKNTINNMRLKYYNNRKHSLPECESCFANTVCFGCLGVNYFETGDIYMPAETHCKLVRSGLERVLANLANKG